MSNKIKIAVDAMGGDNSPEKIIKGLSYHSKGTKDVTYNIFGDQEIINKLISKNQIYNEFNIHNINKDTLQYVVLGSSWINFKFVLLWYITLCKLGYNSGL